MELAVVAMKTKTRKKLTAILGLVVCFAVGQTAARSNDAPLPFPHLIATSRMPRHAVLKSIAPIEDMSVQDDAADLFDQAVKEYSANHLPQAEKLFEGVLKLDPRNADAHFNLGAIREWRNQLGDALRHYKAAQGLKPQDNEIAEAVKGVEYKIKNKAALDEQAAQAKQEQDLTVRGKLAKDAFAAQNYREAAMHLTYLAHAMPDDAKIEFALGQSLRALKYYDWAAYRLKMAIYLEPENDLYRKTLVDLDKEIVDAQGQAVSESAALALSRLAAPSFTELSDTGFRPYAF
jgi:Flp pilus assembly protein TadD